MALSLSILPRPQRLDCALDLSTVRPELVDSAPTEERFTEGDALSWFLGCASDPWL